MHAEDHGSAARFDRNVLTEQQFAEKGFNNAYDVVVTFRTNWLSSRGPDSVASPTQVQAYVDGSDLGNIQTLKAIDLGPAGYIRYFDAVSATARWGLGHGAGVVYVSTHAMSSAAASPSAL